MRVLHITEYCHAGSIGGTERYILELIRGLEGNGVSNLIGWLHAGCVPSALESEGVRIRTLPTAAMRVDTPPPAFHETAKDILHSEKPDCIHFHTFGLTESALATMARQQGIPYAFTYHSPAWTCRNETLLVRHGTEQCDGEVRAWRCASCQSQERLKMGVRSGHLATALSLAAGWAFLPLGRNSFRRRTAFFYDTLRYRRVLRSFLENCKLVVSCCDWSGPVLRLNGAKENCLVHCPQGVPDAVAAKVHQFKETLPAERGAKFVVGFVGRPVEIKGAHILMEGFSRIASNDTILRVVGWEPERSSDPYSCRIQNLAKADARIELVPKTSFEATVAEYRRLSLLAIPSNWMETGPLTLLEGLALHIPVYGSNRIGQLKLLREYGRVVEPNTPQAWQLALTEAIALWRQDGWGWKNRNFEVRSMSDVSTEMLAHYKAVLSK